MTRKPTPGRSRPATGSRGAPADPDGRRAEEALRNAEARYQALFAHSPYGVLLIDAETARTIDFNDTACRQLGYTREEFAALTISDYEAREGSDETRRHIQKVLSLGTDDFDTQHRTRHGEIRQIHVWAQALHLGERRELYCIFQDITDRTRAEAALRESERSLREAQTIAGLGSYILDIATGSWKSTAVLDRVFGIDDQYVRSVEGWVALLHPEWRATMVAYLTEEIIGKGTRFDKEYQIVRRNDQAVRWVHGLGELEFDDQRRPVRMFGTIQDVTERRVADESRQLQSAALNAAANAIVITDRSGVIEWVNPAFTRLTGYTAQEAVGRNPRDLVRSGKHDQAFYRDLWDSILAGNIWRGEMVNRRKDGTLYSESQSITPVRSESGAITHFVAVKEDITERLQLQAEFLQAQKMESVGRLAGGIAHDFNNLLTVINGTADLVLRGRSEQDELQADLQEIRKAGERAASLTRQLLAFSRKQLMQFKVLSPSTVIAGMQSMVRRLIGEDINLVITVAGDPGRVRADPGQIEQVILNLSINARDAMPSGGTLTIETREVTLDEAYAASHPSVVPGPHVRVTVSDTGVGMDEATRQMIFEPFFTTKGPEHGTGLGLATVYGIVKQSRGTIWVDSEAGKGTTFTIYLPRVGEHAPESRQARAAAAARGTETILIVEDEDALRRVAIRILESAGYTVLSAASGAEALRLLDRCEQTVHLLLTDVVMPGMGGPEVAEGMRRIRPQLKVLFTSGYTDDVVARHGVLDEHAHFIGKPYTIPELTGKVRQVLDS